MIDTARSSGDPQSVRAAAWALRVSVAASCIGYARWEFRFGSPIGEYLFNERGWSEAAMLALERGGACALLVVAAVTLIRPWRSLLVAASAWMLLWTLSLRHLGGQFASDIAPIADATRYLAPLALALLLVPHQRDARRIPAATWLLRIILTATFLGHGLEAFWLHPVFTDYLIGAGHTLLGIHVPQHAAEFVLRTIGVIDVALAAAILIQRSRTVAGYMAFWGLVTALSRIVHNGWPAYPDTLIRATHVGAALALLFYWSAQRSPLGEPARSMKPEDGHAEIPPLAPPLVH